MQPDKLVMMANQIATYFATQPGTDQAECVAAHLNDFWEPRMRAALANYHENGGTGLSELAKEAMPLMRVPAA
ncbi:formate dehydrogenase subunit delta [Roseovarius nanhaiticus]|uniref:Formate dehydrogenase subunit delta n=1 Tax=Roseovarius nanhaiticus TaxID=573024 RepID=A0A1N7GUH1_9RHOB|nr:formate dehydrogenase subunit delta [Roseovarius nanhaiticus]SEL30672.1 formate dehydrogenase delta subunit [Roseovarius nanhaiticus]SIS16200.1 formate dehydrogenase subunit delta [Roseovarius nanhaiticus]